MGGLRKKDGLWWEGFIRRMVFEGGLYKKDGLWREGFIRGRLLYKQLQVHAFS